MRIVSCSCNGELAYQLVLQTTERPPSDLLRISLGDNEIITTKGHPFGVNQLGWRMAKRLKIGDQLHTIGGGQTVDGIDTAGTLNAFNLVVANFNTYFVSERGVLVHDNTYRQPTRVLPPGVQVESPR